MHLQGAERSPSRSMLSTALYAKCEKFFLVYFIIVMLEWERQSSNLNISEKMHEQKKNLQSESRIFMSNIPI